MKNQVKKVWENSYKRLLSNLHKGKRCETGCIGKESELLNVHRPDLSTRNSEKSENVQKRLVRRIIEKRQAQQIHRRIGRTEGLLASYLLTATTCNSIVAI